MNEPPAADSVGVYLMLYLGSCTLAVWESLYENLLSDMISNDIKFCGERV